MISRWLTVYVKLPALPSQCWRSGTNHLHLALVSLSLYTQMIMSPTRFSSGKAPPLSRSAPKLQKRLTTGVATKVQGTLQPSKTALSRLPNKTLLRSLVLTSLMSKNWLMRPSLAVIDAMTRSKSALLNPDRNPVLNRVLRWTIYNHFCAGSTKEQVARSMAELRQLGYQGVILGFAKEVVLDPAEGAVHSGDAKYSPACYRMIDEWKEANLETIRMLSPNDFLSVK